MGLIVDSQLHAWRTVLPGMTAHREGPFDAGVMLPLMREAGVAGAALVPTSWDPEGNQASIDAAREHPDRFVVMGLIDSLEGLGDRLAGWRDEGMWGLRLPCRQEPYATWVDSGELDTLWTEVEKAGLPVMAFGPGSKLDVIAAGARAHPGVSIAIDHLAMAPPDREVDVPNDEQLERVIALADLPNVSVKLSSLPLFSRQGAPFADMYDPARRVVEAFGPERCFFGTDLSRQPCTYSEAIAMIRAALADLSEDELDLVLGTALTRWLGWSPAPL
ncbi:amidohydrolase family protein [Intrasporangium mesophilum]